MILIQNIYHMLAYAFQALSRSEFKHFAAEDFPNIQSLYAAIIAEGASNLLRKGPRNDYQLFQDDLSSPKGKINVMDTVKRQLLYRQRLSCQYDEYTADTPAHQALKATVKMLSQTTEVSGETKSKLKTIYQRLIQVTDIDVRTLQWETIKLPEHDETYRMLLAICRLAWRNQLICESDQGTRIREFLDSQEGHDLYERFLRAYIGKHYPEYKVSAAHVEWALDQDSDTDLLPTMRTDVSIKDPGVSTFIVDAKFYTQTMQYHWNKISQHSGNMYQLLTYMENEQANLGLPVFGALLYAKTDEAVAPNQHYKLHGKEIWI